MVYIAIVKTPKNGSWEIGILVLGWGCTVLFYVSTSKYLTSLSICLTLAHTEVFCTVKLRIISPE